MEALIALLTDQLIESEDNVEPLNLSRDANPSTPESSNVQPMDTSDYENENQANATTIISQSTEHENPLHNCPICGKLSASAELFEKHLKTHTKPFACPICRETFEFQEQLEQHEKSHKEFKCTIRNVSISQGVCFSM